MKKTLIIVLHCLASFVVRGTHFIGGSLTWKPKYPQMKNQNPVSIILTQRYLWLRSAVPCDDDMIKNEVLVKFIDGGNELAVKCVSKSCPSIETLDRIFAPCIAYSIQNNWSNSEKSTDINISADYSFEAAYRDWQWTSNLLVGGSGHWSISTKISTLPRTTGHYNTPPSIPPPQPIQLQLNVTHTWKIPVIDVDGDIVRCRWANQSPVDECAAVCGPLRNAFVNDSECSITYTPRDRKPAIIALMIEDFESPLSTTPLSSVSLQFMVQIYSDKRQCNAPPMYYGIQPEGSCFPILVDLTINEVAQFLTKCADASVTEVNVHKPSNMKISPLRQDYLNSSLYTRNITWKPTKNDVGVHLVCFTPLDSSGQQGDQACIKYMVYDDNSSSELSSDHFVHGSMQPMSLLLSYPSEWQIQYKSHVQRPKSFDAFIRFYRASDDKEVYNINVRTDFNSVHYDAKVLRFSTLMIWTEGEEYYILFDRSVVVNPDNCDQPSRAVHDRNFWKFKIVGTNGSAHQPSFVAPTCDCPGSKCDLFNELCLVLNPCKNGGTCQNKQSGSSRYICACPLGFTGTNCEIPRDQQCQSNPCWSNGTCETKVAGQFNCSCPTEWEGDRCEKRVNHCFNITCHNHGVCRSLLGHYTCDCLGTSFYGRHCEFTTKKTSIYRIIAKVIAIFAILIMIAFAVFIVLMDILKYYFHIDPVHKEREKIWLEAERKKRRPVLKRFPYQNALGESHVTASTMPMILETVV